MASGTVPADEQTTIVHADYRLDNMVMHQTRAARGRGARLGLFHPRQTRSPISATS